MKKNFVIGVEGEVGAGKTSMCKELIKIIPNTIFIDGGAIFRGITLAIKKYKEINKKNSEYCNCYKKNINLIDFNNKNFLDSKTDALEIMKKLNVKFKIINMETIVYINGKEIKQEEIETMENSMDVSKMASKTNNKSLFKFANNIIKEYNEKYNIIISARDLVDIYPEMDLHFYVIADINKRIERRFNQYNGKYSYEEIEKFIKERDKIHKEAGFNKKCDKTVKIDLSDCKDSKESAEKAIKIIKEYNLI